MCTFKKSPFYCISHGQNTCKTSNACGYTFAYYSCQMARKATTIAKPDHLRWKTIYVTCDDATSYLPHSKVYYFVKNSAMSLD